MARSSPGRAGRRDASRTTDAGFTTWDLADHYGPAEDFIGDFRRRFARPQTEPSGSRRSRRSRSGVPYPARMTRRVVRKTRVGISLSRMGVECLDLLQFHWWDYGQRELSRRAQTPRRLAARRQDPPLGTDQFSTPSVLRVIADQGIRIVSNQVAILDRRSPGPRARMASFCGDHVMTLLGYGHPPRRAAVGEVPSDARSRSAPSSLPLRWRESTRNMIDTWGGWSLFQELLAVLKQIADRHRVGISNIGGPLHPRPARRSPASSSARGSASHSTSPTIPGYSTLRSTPRIW